MIGIYKIISPNGRIYIGQSRDIEKRFESYITYKSIKGQIRLYNSFEEYGVKNHIFEIIEECEFNQLNICERKWQDYYDVTSEDGLNCVLVDTNELPRIYSDETRLKMSNSQIGKKQSQETIDKKIKAITGLKRTDEFKKRHSVLLKGKKKSEEHCKNLSISHKGKAPKTTKRFCRKIIQLDENLNFIKKWESIKDAAIYYKVNNSSISHCCAGRKNKIKGFIWKYESDYN